MKLRLLAGCAAVFVADRRRWTGASAGRWCWLAAAFVQLLLVQLDGNTRILGNPHLAFVDGSGSWGKGWQMEAERLAQKE